MFYDDYDIEDCNEDELRIKNKIQRLIDKGIDPSRIRKDGTYVMTKEEFMDAITKHYKEKKALEYKTHVSNESDYMDYLTRIFQRRKKKKRRY